MLLISTCADWRKPSGKQGPGRWAPIGPPFLPLVVQALSPEQMQTDKGLRCGKGQVKIVLSCQACIPIISVLRMEDNKFKASNKGKGSLSVSMKT